MDIAKIVGVLVAPSIGIARVGNSPESFFIGPEAPGCIPDPEGGFKDARGRVKRQAARFRVYGIDAQGHVLGEITAAMAEIPIPPYNTSSTPIIELGSPLARLR